MMLTASVLLLWLVVLLNLLLTLRLLGHLKPVLTQQVSKPTPKTLPNEQPAPDFVAQVLEGGAVVTLANYREQSVVLLFASPHCADCRKEMPAMIRLYATLRLLGHELLLVCFDSRPEVEQFVQELSIPMPVLLAPLGSPLEKKYNPKRWTPLFYLLDKGVVRASGAVGGEIWLRQLQQWQEQAASRRAQVRRYA